MISVIDQIIGCGERHGQKHFLVRFKGENQNEIIDWETAKQYSLEVMEYFGSRLVWKSIDVIVDPENDDKINEYSEPSPSTSKTNEPENPSTAQKKPSNPLPNEIEYYSSSD